MDGHRTAEPKRIAIYSPSAAEDLSLNHTITASRWGWEQAERYAELLQATAQEAANRPTEGKAIEERPGVFYVLAKWRWRRKTYGHYVVYRPSEQGAYILRILHSASDLISHIDPE